LDSEADADALPLLKETGAASGSQGQAAPQGKAASPGATVKPIVFRRTEAGNSDGQHAVIWLAAGYAGEGPPAQIVTALNEPGAPQNGNGTVSAAGASTPPAIGSTPDGADAPPALPGLSTSPPALNTAPDSTYQPIQPVTPPDLRVMRLTEPPWPELHRERGYWITARRIRVFPQDKIQFDHSTIFFNGAKLFSMPLYVLPLSGSANPVAGMLGFNSSGGLSLNVPFYYMASPHGTGAVYLQHAPGNGFAAESPGFALAIDQQYFLSRNSYGSFNVDQIGRGDWNFNWQHNLQLSPTLSSRIYVDAPRHRDLYTYATLVKDFSAVQVGLEGSYGRPESGDNSALGQLFARLRPRPLGASGWNYTVSANALARRFSQFAPLPGGGGIGLPGQPRPGTTPTSAAATTLFGQTLNLSLQSPTYRPWGGADIQATVLGTAFNYSDGRRGVAPGVLLGWRQKIGRVAALQLDYNYDKGSAGLYSADFTHYISGGLSLYLGNKLNASAFLSKSLSSDSLYATTGLDFYFKPKWRLGLFSDYSSFADNDALLNYGFSLGRLVGQREVTLNWDSARGRFYVELGGFRL
jgi:hypothetical protein